MNLFKDVGEDPQEEANKEEIMGEEEDESIP